MIHMLSLNLEKRKLPRPLQGLLGPLPSGAPLLQTLRHDGQVPGKVGVRVFWLTAGRQMQDAKNITPPGFQTANFY